MDTSGRQRNSTPPSPDQICTSILCPQHGKNQPKQMPSRSPFPSGAWCPRGRDDGRHFRVTKSKISLDLFNGNTFQDGRPPDLCVISRAGDEFLAVLAYSEI